jgi:adenosylcobinamide-GDP ribazoletransferase
MIAVGWGRWGQVATITFYHYLKPTGKGVFHKQSIKLPQDLFLVLGRELTLSRLLILFDVNRWWLGVEVAVVESSMAILTGF